MDFWLTANYRKNESPLAIIIFGGVPTDLMFQTRIISFGFPCLGGCIAITLQITPSPTCTLVCYKPAIRGLGYFD
jgi:hypothetical protein